VSRAVVRVVLVASLSWCVAAGLTTSAAAPTAMLVRPAGQGLVAGSAMSRRWLLALRARDGTVDAHFAKPDLTPDGRVNAVEPDGRGGWFLAGEFAGVGGVQCWNLVHVYASGQVDRSWCPDPDGVVVSLLARAGDTLYVTGDFTRIGGAERDQVAAIDVRTGRATPWHARIIPLYENGADALAVGAGRVFLGGNERFLRGSSRRIVALDARSGRTLKWNPRLKQDPGRDNFCPERAGTRPTPCYFGICAIAVRGRSVYIAGFFNHARGKRRVGLAALDAVTARPSSWQANVDNWDSTLGEPNSCEGLGWRLVTAGRTLYISGPFNRIHGLSRDEITAVDARTGRVQRWKPRLPSSFLGPPQDIGVSSSSVVIAYSYDCCYGIRSVDRETGRKVRWTRDLSPGRGAYGVGVAGGRVLVFG
jgi:hypothetical protein